MNDAIRWWCIFDTYHSSWWTILAMKKLRKVIPGYMTGNSGRGGQRRLWLYATIFISGCHVWGDYAIVLTVFYRRLYIGITIVLRIFHRVHLFDSHLENMEKHEVM